MPVESHSASAGRCLWGRVLFGWASGPPVCVHVMVMLLQCKVCCWTRVYGADLTFRWGFSNATFWALQCNGCFCCSAKLRCALQRVAFFGWISGRNSFVSWASMRRCQRCVQREASCPLTGHLSSEKGAANNVVDREPRAWGGL